MTEFIELTTLKQIKTLANPIRQKVLECLIKEEMSPKQVAVFLEMKPTRLYHHFKILEKEGLIVKTKSQKKRGIVEQYFKARTSRIGISKDFKDNPALAASVFLQSTADDLVRLHQKTELENKPFSALVMPLAVMLTESKAKELVKELQQWVKKMSESSDKDSGKKYNAMIAFYASPDND